MSFEERRAWMMLVVGVAGYGFYLVVMLSADTPLAETPYVAPMLWTIGGGIVVSIVAHMVMSAVWREEAGEVDQRDREIDQFGERVGNSLTVVGALAGLVLAMFEAPHFWIANALFLGFFLTAALGGMAKLAAYRHGFQ